VYEAFTPQLLSGHCQNESFELRARQAGADVLKASREVPANAILSALLTLQREREGAENRLAIGHARTLIQNIISPQKGRGEVSWSAEASKGASYGCAATPGGSVSKQVNSKVAANLLSRDSWQILLGRDSWPSMKSSLMYH